MVGSSGSLLPVTRPSRPARRGRVGVGPDRAAGLTFEDYLQDTIAVLDTLDGPAVLVGHSLGALLAQRLTEQGRASAIVLIAPAPPAMLTAQAVALPRFLPQMPRIMTGRPFIMGPGSCSALALNKMPEDQRPAVHAHLNHESGKVYRDLMFGSVKIDAHKVRVPAYVAGGPRTGSSRPGSPARPLGTTTSSLGCTTAEIPGSQTRRPR